MTKIVFLIVIQLSKSAKSFKIKIYVTKYARVTISQYQTKNSVQCFITKKSPKHTLLSSNPSLHSPFTPFAPHIQFIQTSMIGRPFLYQVALGAGDPETEHSSIAWPCSRAWTIFGGISWSTSDPGSPPVPIDRRVLPERLCWIRRFSVSETCWLWFLAYMIKSIFYKKIPKNLDLQENFLEGLNF